MRIKNEDGSVRWRAALALFALIAYVTLAFADTYDQTGIPNVMISRTNGGVSIPLLNIRPISGDLSNGQIGDVWFNTASGSFKAQTGASTFGTLGAGSVRTIVVADGSAVSNPTANTTFSQTLAFAANSLAAGNRIRVHAHGKYTTGVAANANLSFTGVLQNGTTGAATALATTGNVSTTSGASSLAWTVDQSIVIRTAGASGTMVADIQSTVEGSGITFGTKCGRLGSTAIDTTVIQTLGMQVKVSTSDASASITMEEFDVYLDN